MADIYNMTDTWNDAGVTFSAIKMDVTDTASDAGSNLLDLQVGGVSKFSVDKQGIVQFRPIGFADKWLTDGSYSIRRTTRGAFSFNSRVVSDQGFWSSKSGDVFSARNGNGTKGYFVLCSAADDAEHTLELRDHTFAQAFNIYNTYTDASNYERGFMRWNSNLLEIGTEAAGTGTKRGMSLNGILISSAGNVFTMEGSGARILNINNNSGAAAELASGSSFHIFGTTNNYPLHIETNNNTVAKFDTTGSFEISTGLTVATLPGTPVVGMMARVTDASTPTTGSTVTDGGTDPALVWYNGTNWTVIGV